MCPRKAFLSSRKLYLNSFKLEGYEQKDNSSIGGSEKGDDDLDLDEDDLLDDEPKDTGKEKMDGPTEKEGKTQDPSSST